MYSSLDDEEYNMVWDMIEHKYQFSPSIYPEKWPGIKEPAPSVTFSWKDVDGFYEQTEVLDNILIPAFITLSAKNKINYILDWQHTCYKLTGINLKESYPLGVFPDGDYHIWLSTDLSCGTFGHPWEESICIIGKELIDLVEAKLNDVLGNPIRKNN